MPPVVVSGSDNNFTLSVVDFGSAPPGVQTPNPTFAGSCVVAAESDRAAVGDHNGVRVELWDITNPAAPSVLGGFNTQFSGVGAVAIRGSLVAAGERNGSRVQLIDFTNPASPTSIGVANTASGPFTSLAFMAARRVVGASTNGPPSFVDVNFSGANPVATSHNVPNAIASSIDADPVAGRIVVGNQTGGQVILLDASFAVLATATTQLAGVHSVAISGTLVLAGSANSFNAARINFAPAVPVVTAFDPGFASGSRVAIEGTTGACGAIVGGAQTPVRIFNLAATPPNQLGTANPGIQSVASISFGRLVAVAPPAPDIGLSTAALAFGPVLVGSSATLAVTITNAGSTALNVTNIQSSSPRYTFAGPAAFAIAPGTRQVMVTFSPTATGNVNGTLSITSNDPDEGTVTVALTGTGAVPQISVQSAPLAFGDVPVCLSGTLPLTVRNLGGLPLTVSGMQTNAPYAALPAAPFTITPNATRTVTVTFAPAAQGATNGTLTISSNDPATPTATVNLTGTGTPTPPPAASVSPTSINLGLVPVQFFAGRRLTVTNGSSCSALTITPSTAAPFFVTTGNPTTLPQNPPGTLTVQPNGSVELAVLFAPTATGNANGTLTIATNDPNNPTLSVALSGTGGQVVTSALSLVLDRSGSMSDPMPGGTKMDALKRAVSVFADLLIPGQNDEMGSVEFDDVVAELTPRGIYDTAKQNAIKNDAGALTPRGATSIGGGLQRGQTQVGGSAIGRKIILVFTDGQENTPPMIATVRPGIVSAGIEVYAIGLGRPQDISAAALSSLAISSNGRFFLTDDELILRKDFVQVLADAFRQQMAADPVATIGKGETVETKVWITDCERRISFVLNWDDINTQLGFELEAPDGTTFTPAAPVTNKLVRYGQQPGYRWFNVAFPPLEPGGGHVGPQRAGQWILRTSGPQVAGRRRFSTSVIVESDLEMSLDIAGGDPRKPLRISVLLEHERDEISDAEVTLRLTSPTRTIQQVVGRAAIERALREAQFLDVGTLFDAAVRLLGASRAGALLRTKKTTVKLKGRRGRFSFTLPPPLMPGVYDYEIEVVGQACGGTFQRYASGSVAIENPVVPGLSGITVTTTGTVGTSTIGTVTFTPVTVTGAGFGPGHGATIRGSLARGTVNAVIDNLDGSYSFHVTWRKSRRVPTLEVAVGEVVVKIPLRPTRQGPKARKSQTRRRSRSRSHKL